GHRDLLHLHYSMKNVRNNYNYNMISKMIHNLNQEDANSILDLYVDSLQQAEEREDFKLRSTLELDNDLLNEFKSSVIKHHHQNASMRNIYVVNDSIKYLNIESGQNEIGINSYIDKRWISIQSE